MFSMRLRESIYSCIKSAEEKNKTIFYELNRLLAGNHNELNSEELNSILDLFIYGLEHSNINNHEKWIKDNSDYFRGNCHLSDVWMQKFKTSDFTFDSLVDYVELIKAEPSSNNLDYSLRNVKITLSEDVTYHDFNMYMDICKSVLNDILNGKAR